MEGVWCDSVGVLAPAAGREGGGPPLPLILEGGGRGRAGCVRGGLLCFWLCV